MTVRVLRPVPSEFRASGHPESFGSLVLKRAKVLERGARARLVHPMRSLPSLSNGREACERSQGVVGEMRLQRQHSFRN